MFEWIVLRCGLRRPPGPMEDTGSRVYAIYAAGRRLFVVIVLVTLLPHLSRGPYNVLFSADHSWRCHVQFTCAHRLIVLAWFHDVLQHVPRHHLCLVDHPVPCHSQQRLRIDCKKTIPTWKLPAKRDQNRKACTTPTFTLQKREVNASAKRMSILCCSAMHIALMNFVLGMAKHMSFMFSYAAILPMELINQSMF